MTGCGASFSKVGEDISGNKVEVTKDDVHASTKMSDSVFLEPAAPEDQIIYFRFRSTADEELDVENKIKAKFQQMGFRVTNNPKEAKFMVQANFLKVGQMDEAEQKNYLGQGYASAAVGAATLGGISMLGNGSHRGSMAAAGVGLLAGLAYNALKVEDVHFALVTDVEIRQRLAKGESGVQNDTAANKQGMSGTSNQSFTNKNVQWKTYRTRVVSSAYGPGLEFNVARPFLEDGMVKAIAGTM
jgi:hypothetical protein